MTKDEIDKLIGYDPETRLDDQMPVVEYAIRYLLVTAMDFSNAAMNPDRPEEHFRCLSAQGSLAATCARLLAALRDEEDPADTAWEVVEAIADGESMHHWVADQLNKLRIEVPA